MADNILDKMTPEQKKEYLEKIRATVESPKSSVDLSSFKPDQESFSLKPRNKFSLSPTEPSPEDMEMFKRFKGEGASYGSAQPSTGLESDASKQYLENLDDLEEHRKFKESLSKTETIKDPRYTELDKNVLKENLKRKQALKQAQKMSSRLGEVIPESANASNIGKEVTADLGDIVPESIERNPISVAQEKTSPKNFIKKQSISPLKIEEASQIEKQALLNSLKNTPTEIDQSKVGLFEKYGNKLNDVLAKLRGTKAGQVVESAATKVGNVADKIGSSKIGQMAGKAAASTPATMVGAFDAATTMAAMLPSNYDPEAPLTLQEPMSQQDRQAVSNLISNSGPVSLFTKAPSVDTPISYKVPEMPMVYSPEAIESMHTINNAEYGPQPLITKTEQPKLAESAATEQLVQPTPVTPQQEELKSDTIQLPDSLNTVDALRRAQLAYNDATFVNQLGKAGELIGSGISGAKPVAQELFDQNIAQSGQGLKNFKDLQAQEADDPKSAQSVQARELLSQALGRKVPEGLSYSQALKMFPSLASLERAKQAAEIRKELAGQKMEQQKTTDLGKFEKEIAGKISGSQQYKDYQKLASNSKQLDEFIKNPTGYSDIASIYNFMKTIDPRSTVRESEYAIASKAGGLIQRVQNFMSKIQDGTQLTKEQRKDLANLASMMTTGSKENVINMAKGYVNQAKDRGAKLENILPGDISAADFEAKKAQEQQTVDMTPDQRVQKLQNNNKRIDEINKRLEALKSGSK